MQQVNLPDGTLLNFPDGMSQDDMRAAIISNFPKFAPAKDAAPVAYGDAMGAGASEIMAAAKPEVDSGKPSALRSEYENLRDSFFTGVDNTRASLQTVGMTAQAAQLQQTQDKIKALEAAGKGDSPEARGLRMTEEHYRKRLPQMIGSTVEAQADAQRGAAMTTRPAVEALNKAKTWGEAWDIFTSNPYDVIAGVTATSLPTTLPALALGAVFGGGIGAAAMGASSAATEAGSSLADYARDNGVDMTDAKAVEAYFSNRENLAAAMSYAGKRAGIIGSLDAATGGIASKTLAPKAIAGAATKQLVNIPTQMAVQMAGGAGGEALGQIATKGQIDQPGQVLAEAAGELAGAPMEVLSFSKEARAALKPSAKPEDILQATSVDEAIQTAQKALVEPTPIPAAPTAGIVQSAQTVDQAIGAAQSELGSPQAQAVDNIGAILGAKTAVQPEAQPAPSAPVAGVEPVQTWFGRRGDGYQSMEDAGQALPGRQKAQPEFDWKIEQMPNGRFRLAGYALENANASPEIPVPGVVADTSGRGSVEPIAGVDAGMGVDSSGRRAELDAASSANPVESVPARMDAAGQPSGALADSKVVGSDAGNGFKHGPQNGERYRVGVVDSVGGAIAIEKRYPAGTAGTFYVGKDGNLIDGDVINLIGSGKEKLWIPATPEQAKQAQQILDEMGKLDLQDPARKDAKERLKQVVSGKSQEASAQANSAGAQPDAVAPTGLDLQAKKDALRSYVDSGKSVAVQTSGDGKISVGPSLDNNTHIQLDLTAEERKAFNRANADIELADTPEERITARIAEQTALRPAIDRAIAPVADPRLTPVSQRNVSPEAQSIDTPAAPVDKAALVMRVGFTPKDAEAVTVQNGVVYIGKTEAVNFDTGEPVTVPQGATNEQIRDALKESGAISRKSKIFGVGSVETAQSAPVDSRLVPVSQRQAEVPAAQRVTTDWKGQPWDGASSYGDPVDSKVLPGDIGTGSKKNTPWASRGPAVGHIFRNRSSDTQDVVQVGKDAFVVRPKANAELAMPEVDQRLVPVSQRQQPSELPDAIQDNPRRMVGQNYEPIDSGAKPFKFRKDAKDAQKQQPHYKVVALEKGFGLIEKTPGEIAAQEQAAKRLARANAGEAGKPESAHAFIISKGGLNQSAMADTGFDRNVRIGNRFLFAGKNKGGLTLAQAAELLHEAGYIGDETETTAANAIKRSATVAPLYTPEGIERMAEAEAQARFDDHLNAEQEAALADDFDPFQSAEDLGYEMDDAVSAGYDEASDPIKLEVNALLAQAEAAGIDTETLREDAARETLNQSEQAYYERTKLKLQQAIAQGARSSGDAENRGTGSEGRQATESTGSTDRGEDAGSQGDAGVQEGLTSPTPEQVTAQQDRAANADELDQREQINREAERQTLTQQVAPEQRRDNTGDMFGGPTAEDVARARDGRREADAVAQAARDAESGQGGLFASEPTTDYTGAYETDLFGEPLPAKRGNDRPARPVGAGVRGNAQPNQALRDTPRPEGDFYVNTIVGSEVTRKLGARLITSASDAATATSYLYKSAVERLDGIVTDQRGKPLAVIGGFKGANTQASVYPATLLGEAVRIPGAAYVWFSHNHPSGTPTLSSADLALNDNLTDAFRGSGIEPQGLLAVSGGGYGYVDAQGNVGIGGDILDPSESVEVPVVERQLGEGRPAESITAPAVAIDVAKSYYAKAKGSGIILLDAQLRVAGWVPISEPMTGELRGTGALNALYRALSQSNAVASIIVHGGELDGRLPGYSQTTILKNIAHAMMRMDVKTLDVINVKSSNPSLAHAGVWDGSNKGPMFSRAQPFYSALSKSIEGMTAKALPGAIWKDGIKGLINKGAVKEDEVEWSGIREWLDLQIGKVSKEDVLAYLDANGVKVTETKLGDAAFDATFAEEGDDGRWYVYGERANGDDVYDTAAEANSKADEYNADIPRGPTKYSQYTLPGGENYREVLLTLPEKKNAPIGGGKSAATMLFERDMMEKYAGETFPSVYGKLNGNEIDKYEMLVREDRNSAKSESMAQDRRNNYKSSHWDQPNVLAHIRLNDRVDSDGARVLFVEELQSDWQQQARKNGINRPPTAIQRAEIDAIQAKISAGNATIEDRRRYTELAGRSDGVPAAPFIDATDKWLTLALKRVITMAAQEGYDKVAFVNGEQSAERYDLSKQIKEFRYEPIPGSDLFEIGAVDTKDDVVFEEDNVTISRIEELVGKEIAQKVANREGKKDKDTYRDWHYLRGLDLKVGGEGMKAFYDQIVPSATKALLKKLGGGQMEAVDINIGDKEAAEKWKRMTANSAIPSTPIVESSTQPGFTITPAMREKASAGLPLFRKGADQTTGLTPTQFTQALSEAFGAKVADRLQAKGVVVPLADQNSLPAHVVPYLRAGDVVFGFYDPRTDRTYAVLENLTPDMVKGLALHEVGVHYGFEAMLGDKKYAAVMRRLDVMEKAGQKDVVAAAKSAKENSVNPRQIPEERLAYLVQNNPEMGIVREIIAAIKAFLFREFGIGEKYLTSDDLTALARAAVQHAARTEPGGVEVPAFMRAYHGTPHAFDKFSTDKIGTGEGAQAYGWGLYFAGKKEIAQHYRSALVQRDPQRLTLDGKRVDPNSFLGRAIEDMAKIGKDAVLQKLDDNIKFNSTYAPAIAENYRAVRKQVEGLSPERVSVKDGNLYEVEIPEEGEYLLWDKPLDEQPQGVNKAIQKVERDRLISIMKQRINARAERVKSGENTDALDRQIEVLREEIDAFNLPLGGTGERYYKSLSRQFGGDRAASEYLASIGVKGIKYLDGTSRADGDGTYNYVIFSADDVAIQNQPAFMRQNEGMANRKDVVGNQGGRSADDSTGGVLFTDENENAIVFERDGFRISVNKPGATSYVVLWAKQEVNGKTYWRKAGTLDTNQKTKKVGGVSGEYLGVSSIEIEKAYRGQGLGLEMYRALISQSAPNIKGIISHTPNRVNKQQVPSIYKKLGAFTDGDNQIIPIGKNEPTAPDSDGAPGRVDQTETNPADPDIRFSRMGTAQNGESSDPTPPELSPWRDPAGRLQFAPGQWLYDKIGDKAGPLLDKLGLKAASPELRHILRRMKLDVAKAQETATAVAHEAMKLSDEEREMVSDLIEKELKAGTVPPEHAIRLAAIINSTMETQTNELVRLEMLSKESADRWRGQYLPRFYESKMTEQAKDLWADAMRGMRSRPEALKGIKGKHLKGRGMYETIPESQLKDYETMGWEVRDPDYTPGMFDGTVQVWRDFTRQERDAMGEIRDSGFRFVMGYMQTQKDIALGKMFESLAQDPDLSSRLATEKFLVQVPATKIAGTEAKMYGKLAGRWVSPETLSQLTAIEESHNDVLQMYRKAMGLWKEGKTVLNPVSHANNIISNISMAHFAGVSMHRVDKYIGAMRDFAKKSDRILEAKEAGLFLGTLSEAELMNTLPDELKLLAQRQESGAEKATQTAMNLMSFYLRKPMGWAYQAEDTFFRYLIYKDAREQGMEPADAVDHAQNYIFTYDDLPKGARRIRDYGIPFFAYTYKAIPALLHTALTHPLRMAAPAAVLWAANAAAYAIGAGDDDDQWYESLQRYIKDPAFRAKAKEKEKLERELLPQWMKGHTALGTQKTIRLGTDELTKLPLFMDMSRMVPGGDLFDVSPNAGGLPIPQPFTPSHPIFTTLVGMLANKDLYFGKELVDANDTRGEATQKRLAWLWKQMSPAIAINNYHWERGMNALAQATGGEVKWIPDAIGGDQTGIGRDGLPVQPKYAVPQTFGIKIRPIDLDLSEKIDGSLRQKMLRDIDSEMSRMRRLVQKGAVAERTYEKAKEEAGIKKDRIKDGLTVDGDSRD